MLLPAGNELVFQLFPVKILQGMVPVFSAKLLCQKGIDLGFFPEFFFGQKEFSADVFAHTLFKPDAAFIIGIKSVQEKLTVVDEFVPQDLQDMVSGELIRVIIADSRDFGMIQLAQVDLPPNTQIRAKHGTVVIGVSRQGNVTDQLGGCFQIRPKNTAGKIRNLKRLFQIGEIIRKIIFIAAVAVFIGAGVMLVSTSRVLLISSKSTNRPEQHIFDTLFAHDVSMP